MKQILVHVYSEQSYIKQTFSGFIFFFETNLDINSLLFTKYLWIHSCEHLWIHFYQTTFLIHFFSVHVYDEATISFVDISIFIFWEDYSNKEIIFFKNIILLTKKES